MRTAVQDEKKLGTERTSDGLDTVRTLAPKLHRSPRTIQAWTKAGRLPHFKIGKSVLYRWEDVLARLNSSFRVN
jgi:Helix-turn-helix domain